MLVVVADTHGRDGPRLDGRTREAVREAELVCHCGDFMTESVLDAFQDAAGEFVGVYGNNDPPAVRERLSDTAVVDHEGVRLALAHGHDHTETALSMFGRQSNADLVCVGHSHDPGFRMAGVVPVLNPGSHADPRWYRPAHAELEVDSDVVAGRLVDPDGTVFDRFEVER
ncbi:metallophosphoesterase [Halorarius halobius]|uniref:metallophosphoesterase n=1 Tax=Halorarius halobius TaxID=2962671 RepID=UPI0020CE7B31|nr:metallophosphoesterase [Halorarius halobius]